MMRVLFISIAFPPKRDPECLQTAKYFKYMSKNTEFEFDVVTSSSPTLHMPYDVELESYAIGCSSMTEIDISESKFLNAIYGKFLKKRIERPDSKAAFHNSIISNIRDLKRPDIIYSRSNPLSSSVAAMKVKGEINSPWVMHLSDPWLLSPLHNYQNKAYVYHQKMEEKCLRLASAITFTSKETIALYADHYPQYAKKFQYFPNVFDADDINHQSNPSFTNKLRILHTGGLVGQRNPQIIIDSLSYLSEEDRNLLSITFVGDADRLSRNILNTCKYSCIEYLGKVSYSEAKRFQQNSEILVLLDNRINDPTKAIYMPSKLLDYFVARKQIVALTTVGGTTDKILSRYGGASFSYSDPERLSLYFRDCIEKWKDGNENYFLRDMVPEEFDAKKNAERLLKLLTKCITSQ